MRKILYVQGEVPLSGAVTIQGAKNATQKILPATVLWPGVYTLKNIALIEDAQALLTILRFLEAKVTFVADHEVQIDTTQLVSQEIPPELTALSTGSFLFAGALLGRFGEAKVWHPGGDRIGKRPVSWHLEAFRRLGASVVEADAYYEVRATVLTGSTIPFARPSANGAINAVIAAMGASGTCIVENVAPEPEICCALDFFQAMGAQIRWMGSHTLQVEGVREGTGSGTIEVIPDRNDAATFLIAGILGHGPVTFHGARAEQMRPLLACAQQIGASVEVSTTAERTNLTVYCDHPSPANLQVTSRPYPGFSTDWGPMFEVLLTQVPGQHWFHETIFARRFAHIPGLVKMGARIQPIDLPLQEDLYNFDAEQIAPGAHAIALSGPSPLHGERVHANDVRAGAALVLAGLVAQGQTEITGTEQIERGYEAFIQRFQQLGAKMDFC